MIEERCGANASQGAALQVSLKQGRGAGVRGQARRGRGSENGLPPASGSEARRGRVARSSAGAGGGRPGIERRPSASIGLRSTRRTRARFFCRCGRECMRYSARALSLGSEGHVSWERYERAGNPVSQWATYERYMGQWSQLAGDTFLGWLDPASGHRWLDVGCGNGVFSEMVTGRCAPGSMHGVDPSLEQLAYARARLGLEAAEFRDGDARALPYPDDAFDVAVMPLVIFFVPDRARGVAEMARVVRPGGAVAAYAWDMVGGGFPYEGLLAEIRALGIAVP